MKRRLMCLLLSALLVFSSVSLFSCVNSSAENKDDDKSKDAFTRNPMTLSMWIPTHEGTSQASVAQVEAAINKITKAQYNTAIELHMIQSDSYEDQVDEKLDEINDILTRSEEEKKERKRLEREAKRNGLTLTDLPTETTEVQMTLNASEDENAVIYPSVTSTQFDIFLIRGYDKFMYYADEKGYLSQIDDELNGSAKLIKQYVFPTFLEQANLYGTTLAVPNNHPMGEYTYLLINKELCDSYYYDPDDMNTLLACKDFIMDVGMNSSVTPLLSEVTTPGLRYWTGSDKYCILATMILDDADPTSKLNIRNIFGLKSYVNTTIMMKELAEAGYIGSNPDATEFGVGVIKGNAKDLTKYGEVVFDEDHSVVQVGNYYVKVLCRPRAGTEDVYKAMFAVSNFTKDNRRSMEIVQLLNTDPDFRTLLQYGVEGVHWEIDPESPIDDPYIKILRDDYKMDLVETGNVFITYPGEGIPMSYWEDGIKQNLDSLLDPLIRFTNFIDDENRKYFDMLDEESAEMFDRVSKMTAAEFEESVDDLKEWVSKSDSYFWLTDTDQDEFDSLVMKYNNFYSQFIQVK